MVQESKKQYLACVAEKYTREPLTVIQLVEAHSPYELPKILEERMGVKVDGKTTYVDWVEM